MILFSDVMFSALKPLVGMCRRMALGCPGRSAFIRKSSIAFSRIPLSIHDENGLRLEGRVPQSMFKSNRTRDGGWALWQLSAV